MDNDETHSIFIEAVFGLEGAIVGFWPRAEAIALGFHMTIFDVTYANNKM